MSLLKNRISAVVAGSAVIVALGATSAVAGNLIGSADIRDGGVHRQDLGNGINARIDNKATDGQVNGLAHRVTELESDSESSETSVTALEQRIAALENSDATGADVNTNWVDGLGATIVDGNTTVLDSRNDDGYAYSTIANLDLPISKGSVIEFTYRLENGAAIGWGAPRVQIRVNGATYSSAHPINPDYGHDNGDGTFTISVPATSMNDNSATLVPEGTITRASLVYDYQDKGTVTFTNLVIDGHPISFQ
ncbi:MAG: hypothetical protein ACJ72P_17350 [Nocardioides sp.]|jgi:hypothetical protein